MAAKKKSNQSNQSEQVEKSASDKDPLILTVSQVAALSNKEKEAFRHSGGTAISDPQ
jgi:hypothetical protein